MMRTYAIAALATALLTGACSQSSSPAGPSSVRPGGLSLELSSESSSAPQSVPFKGNLEGTQTVTPLQPPLAAVNGSASGTATHLGRFTVVFPHTVNFATRMGEGTFTFTAADGDTLVAHFTGLATQEGSTVSIEEHATITGGTGRFADATGSFTVHRIADQATGVTEGSFAGTISW